MNTYAKTKSVLGKNWTLKHVDARAVENIMQKNQDIDYILATLLASRGIQYSEVEYFLNPRIKDMLKDPLLLLDMEKAVLRAYQAIVSKERICIFGDYDVDGATSSALIKRFFRDIGIDVDIYIPDRILEGYGPSIEAMNKIKNTGVSLVITVDCGSSSFDAINAANELNLDVIVIDHHISAEELPKAVAIVNPNRLDETTEYKYLAAVGVSFMFLVALSAHLRKVNFFHDIKEPNLMQYLDIVALGTVCDVMPLINLNRAFVSQGLKVMSRRNNIGIKILSDIAGVNDSPSVYHLGFVIGPRINAGGRVGRSSLGSKLLSTDSEQTALEVALELEKYNTERKDIECNILNESLSKAENVADKDIIMVCGKGWHVGVIGIIAGRLKEKYDKPVVVVAIDESGIGKASCRSIKGIDFGSKVIEARMRGILEAGGGHAMAAGFTVKEERIPELFDFFYSAMRKEKDLISEYKNFTYDIDLTTDGLNIDFVTNLQRLGPFGVGNYEPIVKIDSLYVLSANIVGSKHVSSILVPNMHGYRSQSIRAIAFNAVESPVGNVLLGKKKSRISVVGSAKINDWQQNVQLVISDIIIESELV